MSGGGGGKGGSNRPVMSNRPVEIIVGVLLTLLTVYIVLDSPLSLARYYSKPLHETVVITPLGQKARPAMDAAPFAPFIPLLVCMGTPIFVLFKGRGETTKRDMPLFTMLCTMFVLYGLGVLLLYVAMPK